MSDAAGANDTGDTGETGDDAAAAAAAGNTNQGAGDAGAGGSAGAGDAGGNVVWPDKWREKLAGDDKTKMERLARYATPDKLLDSYLDLEKRFSASDLAGPFPEEGSDEDKSAWREKAGVPATVEGYFEGVPEGLVIGEDDKAGMTVLAEAMLDVNAPPAVAHAAMGAYYKHLENVMAERAEMDDQVKNDTDKELNETYGAEFKRNITDLNSWLGSAGEEVKAAVLSSRTPDGTPLASNPGFIKWMVGQMRDIRPLDIIPGLGSGEPGQALADEIGAIEKRIREDNKGYRADKTMQARYLELIAARDKNKAAAQ
ncbi:MAG TPA: hypothetical protein VNA25_00920 [Phycisphaerae bacterium]|nr:hypothetical protein [Phycisphaerae bacterium]